MIEHASALASSSIQSLDIEKKNAILRFNHLKHLAKLAPVAEPCNPKRNHECHFARCNIAHDTSCVFASWCLVSRRECLDGLIEQKRLSNVFDFGNGALEVECFRQDDLEDLQYISTNVALPGCSSIPFAR